MPEEEVTLSLAWWNCQLSPPSTKASKNNITPGFESTISHLLQTLAIDVLALGEVDDGNIEDIQRLLINLNLVRHRVINLYEQNGNSIDDFCVIYNTDKMQFMGELDHPNYSDETAKNWLKAGKLISFSLSDETPLYLVVCHWQSRNRYYPGSEQRNLLGRSVRTALTKLLDQDEDALIVVLGDFNNEPFEAPIESCLRASRDATYLLKRPRYLFNPFWTVLAPSCNDSDSAHGTYSGSNDSIPTRHCTFDQIMFSAAFVRNWRFEGNGAAILHYHTGLPHGVTQRDVSDHFPIISRLTRATT